MVTACCVLLVASANIANLLLARGLKNRQQAAVDFPAFAGYTGSLCCAGAPRLPTSGSELSLLILVSMQPSMTTENPPVAYTQFLHRRHSLHLQKTIRRSHLSNSPLRVGGLFAANGSLLSLQPADLLAPLTDPTPLTLCRLGRLLRSIGKRDHSRCRPV